MMQGYATRKYIKHYGQLQKPNRWVKKLRLLWAEWTGWK